MVDISAYDIIAINVVDPKTQVTDTRFIWHSMYQQEMQAKGRDFASWNPGLWLSERAFMQRVAEPVSLYNQQVPRGVFVLDSEQNSGLRPARPADFLPFTRTADGATRYQLPTIANLFQDPETPVAKEVRENSRKIDDRIVSCAPRIHKEDYYKRSTAHKTAKWIQSLYEERFVANSLNTEWCKNRPVPPGGLALDPAYVKDLQPKVAAIVAGHCTKRMLQDGGVPDKEKLETALNALFQEEVELSTQSGFEITGLRAALKDPEFLQLLGKELYSKINEKNTDSQSSPVINNFLCDNKHELPGQENAIALIPEMVNGITRISVKSTPSLEARVAALTKTSAAISDLKPE